MTDRRAELAAQVAAKANQTYGLKTAFSGLKPWDNGIIPSGILALDYQSGVGGWRRGTGIEVYGPPHIGKSTMIGYSTVAQAQQMGLLTGMINTEPEFDNEWVIKNGINPAYNVTTFPDNLDDAFEILHDWVFDGTLDFILFDSVVGAGTEADQKEGANARVGGPSKLITWSLGRIIPRMMKNNVTVMFINHIRDVVNAPISGLVDSPGGWAIKHLCSQRIQLKPGRNRYKTKVPGADKPEEKLVGQEIAAVFKKAKANNALGNTARFDYYWIDTNGEYPFGLDTAQDVINTGLISGIFRKEGTWYHYPEFPNGKLYGKPKVQAFFDENPEAIKKVREDVLAVMSAKMEDRALKELETVGA